MSSVSRVSWENLTLRCSDYQACAQSWGTHLCQNGVESSRIVCIHTDSTLASWRSICLGQVIYLILRKTPISQLPYRCKARDWNLNNLKRHFIAYFGLMRDLQGCRKRFWEVHFPFLLPNQFLSDRVPNSRIFF